MDKKTAFEIWEIDEKRGVAAGMPGTRAVAPSGAVRDTIGKIDMSLIPLDLLDGAAKVLTLGQETYGRNNYRRGFPPVQTLGSVFRHLMELQAAIEQEDKDGSKGHLMDKLSGESHVHHLLCSVLITIASLRKDGYRV